MSMAATEFLADRARAIKPSPSMAAKSRVDQLRAQPPHGVRTEVVAAGSHSPWIGLIDVVVAKSGNDLAIHHACVTHEAIDVDHLHTVADEHAFAEAQARVGSIGAVSRRRKSSGRVKASLNRIRIVAKFFRRAAHGAEHDPGSGQRYRVVKALAPEDFLQALVRGRGMRGLVESQVRQGFGSLFRGLQLRSKACHRDRCQQRRTCEWHTANA